MNQVSGTSKDTKENGKAPRVPVVRTSEVFHIGSLDASEKARRFTSSQEGHCLSVSHCPEAWRAIAELGGNPLWTLTKPEGVFLDVLKAKKSKKLRMLIEAWGFSNAYIDSQERWRAWSTDEEGEWRYTLFLTEEQALNEVECDGLEEGPDGGPVVDRMEVLIGTERLRSRIAIARLDNVDAFDFLAMIWAEDTLPALDGVWWRETYAPESLSAPRAGIFPCRFPGWTVKESRFAEVEDDDCEQGLVSGYMKD